MHRTRLTHVQESSNVWQEPDLDAIEQTCIDVWTQLKSRVKELRALEERKASLRRGLAEGMERLEALRAELFNG